MDAVVLGNYSVPAHAVAVLAIETGAIPVRRCRSRSCSCYSPWTCALGGLRVAETNAFCSSTRSPQRFFADGVVGLAFEGMSKIPHATLLEALVAANPSMDAVFAFLLSRESSSDAPDAPTQPSELHLGGYDDTVGGTHPQRAFFPVVTLPSTSPHRRSSSAWLAGNGLTDSRRV